MLTGLNLRVSSGSVVAVMGPSGSGKSTLLHLLGGLLVPDQGEVLLAGQTLSRLREDKRDVLRLHQVGFVFHIHQVSGGQQQRAAIARALVHSPALLLADEPTGSLDEDNAQQVLSLLFDRSRASGAAVVLVTHSREVARACDEVYALAHGSLTSAS
ncbi:MAG: ABC transporter ATP-binding protein [Nocardioides sp.]|uniref:ABC transporter ATP-binding protein n=1 Tax=Nocardioides sp. TaxID=35761 RepID=UPI0039E5C842